MSTDGFVGKGSNHSLEAAVGKAKDAYSQMFPAYPEAPSAENALIRVIGKKRVTVIHRELPKQLPEALRFQLTAEVAGYFL